MVRNYNLTPTLVIANVSEAFSNFLNRDFDSIARANRIRTEQYRGDRTLIWAGDPKLVVTSYPVPSLEYVRNNLGYSGTELIYPQKPTDSLCNDIVSDDHLLELIIAYANNKELTIIPYATTPQFIHLIEILNSFGVALKLPETPSKKNVWLLRYIDTKSGFRTLVSNWLAKTDVQLPDGFICKTITEAIDVVEWFVGQNRDCIVKADLGTNGYGNLIVTKENFGTRASLLCYIESNTFFANDLIVVEEFIYSRSILSPSFECFIPPPQIGGPQLTYVSRQLFREYGDFRGVLTSKNQQAEVWYSALVNAGLIVAKKMQELGYVGFFDMDSIVDDQGRLYPVEINPRRTGGTHVHDFAKYYWGNDYLDHVVILSYDPVSIGIALSFNELLHKLNGLVYPINNENKGVIVTVSSSLIEGEFGCLIVGRSEEEAVSLLNEMMQRFNISKKN